MFFFCKMLSSHQWKNLEFRNWSFAVKRRKSKVIKVRVMIFDPDNYYCTIKRFKKLKGYWIFWNTIYFPLAHTYCNLLATKRIQMSLYNWKVHNKQFWVIYRNSGKTKHHMWKKLIEIGSILNVTHVKWYFTQLTVTLPNCSNVLEECESLF